MPIVWFATTPIATTLVLARLPAVLLLVPTALLIV
jgi:hypothetical protein